MLVDDVRKSQESSTALLTADRHEIAWAADGGSALQLLAKRRHDAVLYQILEPAKEAIDFVRRLALNRAASSVPVVLVTALNEFQIGSFLNGVPGVRRILYCPCPPEMLREAVAQAVHYSQTHGGPRR